MFPSGLSVTGKISALVIACAMALSFAQAVDAQTVKVKKLKCSGCVKTKHIKNGQVKNQDIANNAINSGKIQNGAVVSSKIQDGTVDTADLADDAVISSKIADGGVENADLADGAVNSGKIADGTVGNADLANDAVNSAKVAPNSLTAADLATNSVGADEIASNAVGSAEVAAKSLTGADLNDDLSLGGSIGSDGDFEVRSAGFKIGNFIIPGVPTVTLDGQTGTVQNSLSGNGVIKAWCRIKGSTGAVLAGYRCNTDAAQTRILGPGYYEVDFTLATNITARPHTVSCSANTPAAPACEQIQSWLQSNDESSLLVQTRNFNGAPVNSDFTVMLY